MIAGGQAAQHAGGERTLAALSAPAAHGATRKIHWHAAIRRALLRLLLRHLPLTLRSSSVVSSTAAASASAAAGGGNER
jgi:hypothetical protein